MKKYFRIIVKIMKKETNDMKINLDFVFHIDVNEDILTSRIEKRAKQENITRKDDTSAVLIERLKVYNRETKPVLDYYSNNLIDILKIWEGGMSFHGGLLGVIFVSILFAKKNQQNPFNYLDIIALVAPIGIFFGRVSNFINSELYGNIPDVPWAVQFIQIDNFSRHPSQLYEAVLEGIVLFLILLYFQKKEYLKVPGLISGLFLTFYSLFRFLTEFFRAPDEQLGYLLLNLTMGQIISIIFFLIGTYLIVKKNENRKKI